MAWESCVSEDGHRVFSMSDKVVRLKSGALLGGAGDYDDRAVRAVLEGIKSYEKMPTAAALAATKTDYAGLLVLPRGDIVSVQCGYCDDTREWYGEVMKVQAKAYAIGSGSSWALAAMDNGKSAHQAVAYACTRDNNSRPPIYKLELKPCRHRKRRSRTTRGRSSTASRTTRRT